MMFFTIKKTEISSHAAYPPQLTVSAICFRESNIVYMLFFLEYHYQVPIEATPVNNRTSSLDSLSFVRWNPPLTMSPVSHKRLKSRLSNRILSKCTQVLSWSCIMKKVWQNQGVSSSRSIPTWARHILTWAGHILTWAGHILTWAGQILSWTGHILTWAGYNLTWAGHILTLSRAYSYLSRAYSYLSRA